MQSFLQSVLDRLPKPPEPEPATPAAAAAAAPAADGDAAAAMDTEDAPAAAAAAPAAAEANGNAPAPAAPAAPAMDPVKAERLTRLRGILAGTTPIGLTLEFLYHNNPADLQVRPWGGAGRGGWGCTRRGGRDDDEVGTGLHQEGHRRARCANQGGRQEDPRALGRRCVNPLTPQCHAPSNAQLLPPACGPTPTPTPPPPPPTPGALEPEGLR
jgi:hypothetical protein